MSMNLHISCGSGDNGYFDLHQTPTKVSYELCQGNVYSVFANYTKWLVDGVHAKSFDGYNGDLEKFDELQMVYGHIYGLSVFIQENPNARFYVS